MDGLCHRNAEHLRALRGSFFGEFKTEVSKLRPANLGLEATVIKGKVGLSSALLERKYEQGHHW